MALVARDRRRARKTVQFATADTTHYVFSNALAAVDLQLVVQVERNAAGSNFQDEFGATSP
ncbi:hypothetical protein [Rubidibacter lacunae]|uniref:hypothetical protein n=1 Tax=Rubidibacter lacunae TaxID=582514 RepID=UPI0004185D26